MTHPMLLCGRAYGFLLWQDEKNNYNLQRHVYFIEIVAEKRDILISDILPVLHLA